MKVITFGEIMLRLSPELYTRFVQAEKAFDSITERGEFSPNLIFSKVVHSKNAELRICVTGKFS